MWGDWAHQSRPCARTRPHTGYVIDPRDSFHAMPLGCGASDCWRKIKRSHLLTVTAVAMLEGLFHQCRTDVWSSDTGRPPRRWFPAGPWGPWEAAGERPASMYRCFSTVVLFKRRAGQHTLPRGAPTLSERLCIDDTRTAIAAWMKPNHSALTGSAAAVAAPREFVCSI